MGEALSCSFLVPAGQRPMRFAPCGYFPGFSFRLRLVRPWGRCPQTPASFFVKKAVTSQWDVAQQLTEPAGEKTKKLHSLRGSFFTRR